MSIPVVIRYTQGAWWISHAKSYQNAFRRCVNGYTTREEAVQFAENNGCEVVFHTYDRLQRQMNTTLNEIREYSPCKPSWDKLLKSLGKTKADDEPLSFKYILESNGIGDAIWCLRVLPYTDTCLFRADIAESVLHITANAANAVYTAAASASTADYDTDRNACSKQWKLIEELFIKHFV